MARAASGIGLTPSYMFQLLQCYAGSQQVFALRHLLEKFEGGCPALVYPPAFAVGFGNDLGDRARTMEVDVGVEVVAMKHMHRLGVTRIDVAVSNVFAYDGSVLAFH